MMVINTADAIHLIAAGLTPEQALAYIYQRFGINDLMTALEAAGYNSLEINNMVGCVVSFGAFGGDATAADDEAVKELYNWLSAECYNVIIHAARLTITTEDWRPIIDSKACTLVRLAAEKVGIENLIKDEDGLMDVLLRDVMD